jgi:hypothetical protein
LFLEAFGAHAAVEDLTGDAGGALLHRLVLDGSGTAYLPIAAERGAGRGFTPLV